MNRKDFMLVVAVRGANPNGDPADGNRPRTDLDGYGIISAECIKRKIRNRLQDEGASIFYQSEERFGFDGCKSLEERYNASEASGLNDEKEKKNALLKEYEDIRMFGAVIAVKEDKKKKKTEEQSGEQQGVSIGIRGPVTVHEAFSINPIAITDMQITKSMNGKASEKGKGSDTMGHKYFVDFGLYIIKGSVNGYLAENTGLTDSDVNDLKEALRSLFVSDASSARPDGSMEIVKFFWWDHNCKKGQYPPKKVFDSVKIRQINDEINPKSADDYEITVDDSYQSLGNELQHEEIDAL